MLRRSKLVITVALAIVLVLGVGAAAADPVDVTPKEAGSSSTTLNLTVKRYAGGPKAWTTFPAAVKAGWTNPAFFPIAVWYGSCGDADQYAYDKALGVNTYVQCNPGSPAQSFRDAGLSTLGLYPGYGPSNASAVPGISLDDEVDGRITPDSAAQQHLTDLDAQYSPPSSGRFSYVNYTSGIVTYDRSMANSSAFLNGSFNDVISLDSYVYSNPQCSWTDANQAFRYRTPPGQTPIDRRNCRTASTYGKFIDLLRDVDRSDGVISHPIWALVEVIATDGPGNAQNGGTFVQIQPAQVKAAAWQSILHGAAGIDWFTNSFESFGPNACATGDALRTARLGGKAQCPAIAANVAAMGEVNRQILALAPVLNTPTYRWDGGAVDSMLKAKDGSAYLFAMTKDGSSGPRTMYLPKDVKGTTVEVVGENRTLKVSGGSFADTFAAETTLHIYKIRI